jgi:hypothetical protein
MSCEHTSKQPRKKATRSDSSGAPAPSRSAFAAQLIEAVRQGLPIVYEQAVMALDEKGNGLCFEDVLALGNPADAQGRTLFAELVSRRGGVAFEDALPFLDDLSASDLAAIGNPARKSDGRTLAHELAGRGKFLTTAELLALGNPADKRGWTVAHEQAAQGQLFDTWDVAALGNPADKTKRRLSDVIAEVHARSLPTPTHALKKLTEWGDPPTLFDLLALRQPYKRTGDGSTYAHQAARKRGGAGFTVSDLIAMGNPRDKNGQTVAHDMIFYKGTIFDLSELLALGNPANKEGRTLAHFLIRHCGVRYSRDELLALGNPKDKEGLTLAHEMAASGYRFSVDDLLALDNPANKWGDTVAGYMVGKGYAFSMDDLLALAGTGDGAGRTVAHEMARKGHQFSFQEVQTLGNPADQDGQTLAHVLAQRGHTFSDEEIALLGDPENKLGHRLSDVTRKMRNA